MSLARKYRIVPTSSPWVSEDAKTSDVSKVKWKAIYMQNRNDNWEITVHSESESEKNPSSRIRTSDLRMTIQLLQSSALPTELSKEQLYN